MFEPDLNGLQMAYKAGAHARRLGAEPHCPFGVDIHPVYYEEWHRGWRAQDEQLRREGA